MGLGEACVADCIKVLSTGDTSLADCLVSVNAMLPMCTALARYAATDAKRLKDLAAVCITVCDDCAKECEKHADKHAECKACVTPAMRASRPARISSTPSARR